MFLSNKVMTTGVVSIYLACKNTPINKFWHKTNISSLYILYITVMLNFTLASLFPVYLTIRLPSSQIGIYRYVSG